jgi:hypothetical protein
MNSGAKNQEKKEQTAKKYQNHQKLLSTIDWDIPKKSTLTFLPETKGSLRAFGMICDLHKRKQLSRRNQVGSVKLSLRSIAEQMPNRLDNSRETR